jgi:hypothetical protein
MLVEGKRGKSESKERVNIARLPADSLDEILFAPLLVH